MNILEKINSDLKAAMINKEELVLSTLRLLTAAIKNKKIELLGSRAGDLSEEEIIAVIRGEIKKRKEAIENYLQGGRKDLADKEGKEIIILEKYLPEPVSDEEIKEIIKKIIANSGGEKNFGQLMKLAMAELKGKAEGSKVSEIVKQFLQ